VGTQNQRGVSSTGCIKCDKVASKYIQLLISTMIPGLYPEGRGMKKKKGLLLTFYSGMMAVLLPLLPPVRNKECLDLLYARINHHGNKGLCGIPLDRVMVRDSQGRTLTCPEIDCR
jgi:hypothetical protein